MSIFVIADLHLSFRVPKPMDIFGDNWSGHEEKIRKDWIEKVKEDDLNVVTIQREGEKYYYITSKQNSLEIKIKGGKVTRINAAPVEE